MTTKAELEKKLWKALKSDRTLMLALDRPGAGGEARPMTAIVEDGKRGVVWIFSSSDSDLVKTMKGQEAAVAHFVSKRHDLCAALRGTLSLQNDQATVDRLWNPFIAAWYVGGKRDPKLRLLRFDLDHARILDHAHVWLKQSSLSGGPKKRLGSDLKKEYADIRHQAAPSFPPLRIPCAGTH